MTALLMAEGARLRQTFKSLNEAGSDSHTVW